MGAMDGLEEQGVDPSQTPPRHNMWTTKRAIGAHIALLIWIPGCVTATWWQLSIALSGDWLGWVYTVMWPCFAVFGTVLWWTIVHDDPDSLGLRGVRRIQLREAASGDSEEEDRLADELIQQAEEEDPELAEYNAYLASLARDDQPKSWLHR
jgi:hypothetical protein